MRYLIIFLLMIQVCLGVPANHYVTQSGAGDKLGGDWDNAFEDLPTAFVREDTYYIADGNYGRHSFTQAADGVKVITIKKAVENDHGTDTGWSFSMGDGQAIFQNPVGDDPQGNEDNAWYVGSAYWEFDGVTGGGPNNWDAGFGFKILGPADGDNKASVWGIQLGNTGGTANPDNSTFRHIEIEGTDWENITDENVFSFLAIENPINTSGVEGGESGISDVTIEYCYVNHFHMCFFDDATNITFRYNYLKQNHNNTATGSKQQNGIKLYNSTNITVAYNIFENCSGTGILTLAAGDNVDGFSVRTPIIDDVFVYGNIFWYKDNNQFGSTQGHVAVFDSGLATYTETTIAFVDSDPDTITDSEDKFVVNNFHAGRSLVVSGSVSNDDTYTIASVAAGTITLDGGDSLTAEDAGATVTLTHENYIGEVDGIYVYNNTFVRLIHDATNGSHGGVRTKFGETFATFVNFDVKNNIFSTIHTFQVSGLETALFFNDVSDNDYNWFYDVQLGSDGEVAATLAGNETNGQLGWGNPLVNVQGMDFRLITGTDPGEDLGSPFNIDMFGDTRPTGRANRGALQDMGGYSRTGRGFTGIFRFRGRTGQ